MDDIKTASDEALEIQVEAMNRGINSLQESIASAQSRLNELKFVRDSMTAELRRRRDGAPG